MLGGQYPPWRIRTRTTRRRNHGSLGLSYSEFLAISNENRDEFIGDTFENLIDPAIQIGYEHFITDNLMFLTNFSYGENCSLSTASAGCRSRAAANPY